MRDHEGKETGVLILSSELFEIIKDGFSIFKNITVSEYLIRKL